MKILICSSGIPPFCGGAEQVAWETAVRLAKYKDLNVHLLTYGSERKTEDREGITIHFLKKRPLSMIYYSTLGYKDVEEILNRYNFDVIHSHGVLPFGHIFRNVYTKKIITCHGSDVYHPGIKNIIFTKIALKKADILTTVSKLYVKIIKNKWGKESQLIQNGVDLANYRLLNVDKKNNFILFVGRYIKVKGIFDLIDTAKELPQYNFYFAGSGKLVNKIAGSNIFNLGFKKKEELSQLYNKATLCVFPTMITTKFTESFGIVALEAISCGCPVIVTSNGFTEFIKDKEEGIVIPSKNKLQLKEAIITLMENKELRDQMGKKGIIKAKQFSWDRITKEYHDLYFRILK